MVVTLAMIAIAGVALTLFIWAGSWAGSDQIASTLGFFLGLAGLGLGVITLLMQIEASRSTAGQQQLQPLDADKATAPPNKDSTQLPKIRRRRLRLKWKIRLGAPAAATGAGGCLVEGALGATVASSIAAIVLTVSPTLMPSRPVDISRTITNGSVSLQVDISPATVGNNKVQLYAHPVGGKPLTLVAWSATAALPAKDIEPIEIPLLRVADFHVIGDITLPAAGDWTFKVTVWTRETEQSTLTMTARIR
ncbi:hypothetical protein ACWEOZ_06460 [Actinoplanes sp. NPDC004185]